jgi:CubicO group peptidase (beta-lactamase class C family)
MRVMSREQQISRSELIHRGRQLAIAISLALSIAACGGGGGGGGGGTQAPVQQQPQNAAPTVQAGTDQTIEWPTASAQLTGSATDDAAQTLTYSWTATSGPSGVTFGTANAAATSVTFPSAGAYVLTLSVSDGSLSATDTVSVTVNAATYPASDTANDTTDHGWTRVAAAADVGMTQAGLDQAATYAQTAGSTKPGSAGMIVRRGRVVHSWGDIDERFDMKSTSKSIGGMALGLALNDSLVALSDVAQTKLPTIGAIPASNAATNWLDDITILQLATHTAGFDKPGGYNPTPPAPAGSPTLIYQPGTIWAYSDSGLNWLSEVLTAVFNQDLSTVLQTRVWSTLGLNSTAGTVLTNSDVFWRDNALRTPQPVPHNRELASGISANVNAMARVGLLFLRKGNWNGTQVLPESFVTTVSTPVAANASLEVRPQPTDFPSATTNYGVLWWTNATGQLANVPRDAYWAWGLGDSLIVVIPSLDLVVVRAGEEHLVSEIPGAATPGQRVWNDTDWNGDYTVLAPFLDPIVQSVSQ